MIKEQKVCLARVVISAEGVTVLGETVETVWNFIETGAYPALKCGVNKKVSRAADPPWRPSCRGHVLLDIAGVVG